MPQNLERGSPGFDTKGVGHNMPPNIKVGLSSGCAFAWDGL